MRKALCISLACLAAASLAQADLLTNGDFTSDLSGWSNSSGTLVKWDGENANGSPNGPNVQLDNNVWLTQQFAVEAGKEYTVSLLATLLSNTSGQDVFLYSKVEYGSDNISGHQTLAATQGSWTELTYNFTATQTGDYWLCFLSAVNASLGSPAFGTVSYGLDSVSVSEVPEPATTGLLAIGAVAGLVRRRRKRQ